MINKIRDFCPIEFFTYFCKSFVTSIITYGLLLYGSAAEANLEKIGKAPRLNLESIFFKIEVESVGAIFESKSVPIDFELQIKEFLVFFKY